MGTVKDGEKSKEILDEMELKILLDATGRLPVYLSGWYDALKETMQHSLKGEKLSFEIAVKALQSQPAVEKMFEDLNAMFEKASEKAELTKLVDGIGNFKYSEEMLCTSRVNRDVEPSIHPNIKLNTYLESAFLLATL